MFNAGFRPWPPNLPDRKSVQEDCRRILRQSLRSGDDQKGTSAIGQCPVAKLVQKEAEKEFQSIGSCAKNWRVHWGSFTQSVKFKLICLLFVFYNYIVFILFIIHCCADFVWFLCIVLNELIFSHLFHFCYNWSCCNKIWDCIQSYFSYFEILCRQTKIASLFWIFIMESKVGRYTIKIFNLLSVMWYNQSRINFKLVFKTILTIGIWFIWIELNFTINTAYISAKISKVSSLTT